jgi:hypothetical protein
LKLVSPERKNMDLNIIPLEDRIVMDAAGGLIEASDAVYADSSYEEEEGDYEYEVDETAEAAEGIIGEAADSILASYALDPAFDPEEKQVSSSEWIEEKNTEEIVISGANDSVVYNKDSEWVKADSLLDDEERNRW